MVSPSKILCRRVMWGLLLAFLILPLVHSVDAAPPAQSGENRSLALRSAESGSSSGGFAIQFLGMPGLPGGGGGGVGNPTPEDGDPDDFGCRLDIRVVEFLLTEVYIMMWL